MSYQYVFDPIAFKEYKSSIKWYLSKSEQAADNFIKEVTARIRAICSDPTRYRNTYNNFREVMLVKFPFSIVYFVDEDNNTVVIVSVFHNKRNPQRKYPK